MFDGANKKKKKKKYFKVNKPYRSKELKKVEQKSVEDDENKEG